MWEKTKLFKRCFALAVSVLGLAACDLDGSGRGTADLDEPPFRQLPIERMEARLWSPQSEALIQAFSAHQENLESLRTLMHDQRLISVWLLDDIFLATSIDGTRVAKEDIENLDQWADLMARTNVVSILRESELGIVSFALLPPHTTPGRNETVDYHFNHPIPAKPCSDSFSEIACGVCDVPMEGNWFVRFSWTTGEFETEYQENFTKVFQDENSGLTHEETVQDLSSSRKECKLSGLRKMGYKHPDLY